MVRPRIYLEHAIAVLSCFTLTGCPLLGLGAAASGGAGAAASAPVASSIVTNPSIFDFVGKDDTTIMVMSPAALLDGSTRIETEIIQQQCKFRTADPVFFVPEDKAQNGWTFAGRMNEDHVPQEAQVLVYRSVLTLGFYGSQQLNTWPLSMVSLSDFPREYLEERLYFIQTDKLSAEYQKVLVERYIADSDKIQMIVARLESMYDPQEECLADHNK